MVAEGVVVDEPLDGADRHGRAAGTEDAGGLAELFLRADPRADLGQIARAAGECGGPDEITGGGERHPFGDAIRERTAAGAERLRALDAAGGLLAHGGLVEDIEDLAEIMHALPGRTLRRRLTAAKGPGILGIGGG